MQLRGVRPFFSNKFDITKHKQYHLLSDYDEKNAFDIEKYVKNLYHAKIRNNDTVDELAYRNATSGQNVQKWKRSFECTLG